MILKVARKAAQWMLQPFRTSLRYRLMLLMVAIAVIPLSLVTMFAARTTRETLSSEVIRSNEARMEWAAKYFDEKFDQLQAVSYSLLLDQNLFPDKEDSGAASDNAYVTDAYVKDKLRALYGANNKNIAQITLYLHSRSRLFIVDKDAVRTTAELRQADIDWGEMGARLESVNNISNGSHNTFTLIRSMNRFENRAVLGGVSLDVRWSMMSSVLDMVHSEAASEVFILDNTGNILFNPYNRQSTPSSEILSQVISNPSFPGYTQLKDGILFYQPAVSGRLWIVKFIPISYVTSGADSTLQFSFYTAVLFSGIAIILSILTAYFTTKPIIRLTRSMKAMEVHNFDVGLSKIRSDEIGTLERRFNSMLIRIKELIQIEYKSKIEKRTAQLKAMQAQINPHFLYNALQSIGGIALSRNVPEIYEHVRAISELFRYTVRMKADLVAVSDELEHVGNYLHIQKLRFRDMLEVQFDVEKECLSCPIPKFSLQPIVENCFIHGLEGKADTWSVTIRARKILDEIEISIEDNGIGIGTGRLSEIRQKLKFEPDDELQSGGGLGMSNVHARIKLNFGDQYGLFVSSEQGAGTTVQMIIPALQYEDGGRKQ